ncbi:MAG: nucleotidyl transferase AbiEii/AbiGii toxin family protein [Bacteriovorax sp.]|nr:nucleotidyl transferase AbiEii/AbiGii toxin family protein [Bacteriovorax sp.]
MNKAWSIEEIIVECLTCLYSNDYFKNEIYLKGGQAVRLVENIDHRFSSDIDFSTSGKIEKPEEFFVFTRDILKGHFNSFGLHVFDCTWIRKPKVRSNGLPDFWSGWQLEFKLIDNAKSTLEGGLKSKAALVPRNTNSPKITMEISEFEYCGSVQKVKIQGSEIKAYSRILIILEKVRAICQQHPDYKYSGNKQRTRDFYDIANLISKSLKEDKASIDLFYEEAKKHIGNVFMAKEVPLVMLDKIFSDDFLEIQRKGWTTVEATTTSHGRQSFDFYVEVLKEFIRKIR